MSWMSMLYQTYQSNEHMAGRSVTGAKSLSPVSHMTANAQLEITVDTNGEFVGASEVAKDDSQTLIPVTEKSAARANAPAPHALCDNLPYIAEDYPEYITEAKAIKVSKEKFSLYISALEKWKSSEYSTPKVDAIYGYLTKGTVIADLIGCGLLHTGENGKLDGKKISGSDPEKALVRFRVSGTYPDAVWQDPEMFSCYTAYYLKAKEGRKDVCYLLGEELSAADAFPKGIVAANYGAKLMSANDSYNYTYRGRFENPEQAFSVSYDAAQKVHAALTWLAANQGEYIGTKEKRTFICFNPLGKPVYNPCTLPELRDEGDETPYTEPVYKEKVRRTFAGYHGKLEDCDDIVIIALDAATTGRLSIVYYNELKNSDFYERIQRWFESCNWFRTAFTAEKKPYQTVETPFTQQIVKCAYGTDRGNYLEADDRVLKQQTQTLLHCMIDAQRMPADMMHRLVINASEPLAHPKTREQILRTACAVIKKYYYDKEGKEVIIMELDENNNDRSYLFGRLLAIAEFVERIAYDRGTERDTNALRLQSAFVHHPFSVYKTIYLALTPYFSKLRPGSREYYRNLMADIVAKLSLCNPALLNTPLSEMYLIGYSLQRNALREGRKTDEAAAEANEAAEDETED